MKVGTNAGSLLHSRNNPLLDDIKANVPSTQELNSTQQLRSATSQNMHSKEAFRATSDDGKLEVLTYTSNGKLNLPSRYEEHRELIERVANSTSKLYLHDTPAAAEEIANEYDNVMAQITKQHPELQESNWGFSINSLGKLVTTGNLSEQQRQAVEETLNSNDELVRAAQNFKTSFLEGLEAERGQSGASQYWGKYNVNDENFSQVIDFKEMITQSLNDNKNRESTGYMINKAQWTLNISEQLRTNADPIFEESV